MPSWRAPAPAAQRDGGAGVLHRGRVGVLGRQAVVDAQAHRARGVGELARDAIEGLDVADVPPAAVQPDQDAERLGRDGGPVGARPHATAVGDRDDHVLDACDLLHRPAELDGDLEVGRALGREVGGAELVLRGEGLDQGADLRVQAGAHALASAPGAGRDGRLDALGDRPPGESDLGVQQRGLAVGHVAVGQADAQDARDVAAAVVQALPDRRPEAAGQHALLDGDQQLVLGRQRAQQLGVERLGEAGVDHGDLEAALGQQVRRLQALLHAGAIADDRPPCRPRAGSRRARSRSARAPAASARRRPRRAGSAARPGRRRRSARCAACARASPRRAGP